MTNDDVGSGSPLEDAAPAPERDTAQEASQLMLELLIERPLYAKIDGDEELIEAVDVRVRVLRWEPTRLPRTKCPISGSSPSPACFFEASASGGIHLMPDRSEDAGLPHRRSPV